MSRIDAYLQKKFIAHWALIPILGVGFILRLYRLGYQSLWYDEGVSVFLARQNIDQLVVHTAGDIHPPLYYIFLHVWLKLAGDSEFAAGFLSALFGLLIIAAVYYIGATSL